MISLFMHHVLHVLNSRCNVVECREYTVFDVGFHASCVQLMANVALESGENESYFAKVAAVWRCLACVSMISECS